ncbi:hypothetical protein ROZALSC1DRAFT_29082 [Rozella allomycis CSF55]|uniref:Large ribosomal subunit protein bL21m n=1 Tax=Rozella allomycis (strain CSF55) TaxID=988480 RepID=A0A4P9YIA6_ROZAC|nr:hypothetical protein ROZALSC1DRAFT_29082 [Rozella allomycis CSF55]
MNSLTRRFFSNAIKSTNIKIPCTSNLLDTEKHAITNIVSSRPQISPSTINALQQMQKMYPYIYAKVYINNFPYTVTKGDIIVSGYLRDYNVGDLIRFDTVSEIGTRDATLKGNKFIDPNYYFITGVVLSQTFGKKIRCRIGYKRLLKTIKKKEAQPKITMIRIRESVSQLRIVHHDYHILSFCLSILKIPNFLNGIQL